MDSHAGDNDLSGGIMNFNEFSPQQKDKIKKLLLWNCQLNDINLDDMTLIEFPNLLCLDLSTFILT